MKSKKLQKALTILCLGLFIFITTVDFSFNGLPYAAMLIGVMAMIGLYKLDWMD